MPSELAPAEREAVAISEAEVDDVLAACDGDPRATIKALLISLDRAWHEASWGYMRGRPSRRVREASSGDAA